MCTKGGRERRGGKQEINSSEANTVPNSQYNINFGRWLDFIVFYLVFLDELIYYKLFLKNMYKKKGGMTASSAS